MQRPTFTHLVATTAVAVAATGVLLARTERASALTPASSAAHAAGHVAVVSDKAKCSPSKGRDYPQIMSPCNGATITLGKNFTFKIRDLNPQASQYKPFIYMSLKVKYSHGVLLGDGNGIDEQLKPVPHRKGYFELNTAKLPRYDFSGYWEVTPGTYTVQVDQITDEGTKVSVNEKLHLVR
jgi:hypothetical protein